MSLFERARAYLGVPWVHQGRDPAIGLDCIGLVEIVLRDQGRTAPFLSGYKRLNARGQSETLLRARELGFEIASDGEIAAFAGASRDDRVNHYGIIRDSEVIHAARSAGKVIQSALPLPGLRLVFRLTHKGV